MYIIFWFFYTSVSLMLLLFIVKGIELKFQQSWGDEIRKKIDKNVESVSFELLKKFKSFDLKRLSLLSGLFSFVYNLFYNFYLLVLNKIDNLNFLIRRGRKGNGFYKKGNGEKTSKFINNIKDFKNNLKE